MLTFSELQTFPGATQTSINASKGSKPYGQIYWFSGMTQWVHAKALTGQHKCFEGGSMDQRVRRAKAWLDMQANGA